jgi:bifunctional ADP-heptose synthase (sugar kinase/adenylyltransferase)
MVGSKEVRAKGGTVVAIPLVEGFSTTSILRKMMK